MEKKNDKIMAVCMGSLYLLQIIPLLLLGMYNHPTSDDFLYGKAGHDMWVQTGSFISTIGAAMQGVAQDYRRWQGSFSALFFMRLQPAVFGEKFYGLVPFIMIGLLSLAMLYFMYVIFRDVFHDDSLNWLTWGRLVVVGVFLVFLLGSGYFLEFTTLKACKVLLNGDAAQYHAEYMERLRVLEDPEVEEVVFPPYSVEADLVFIADGTADPDFVNNREWADYYGKKSLIIQMEEQTDE